MFTPGVSCTQWQGYRLRTPQKPRPAEKDTPQNGNNETRGPEVEPQQNPKALFVLNVLVEFNRVQPPATGQLVARSKATGQLHMIDESRRHTHRKAEGDQYGRAHKQRARWHEGRNHGHECKKEQDGYGDEDFDHETSTVPPDNRTFRKTCPARSSPAGCPHPRSQNHLFSLN